MLSEGQNGEQKRITIFLDPKDPFLCLKNSGFPRSNPMTWGWDVFDHQSYSIGRGLESSGE